MVLQAAMLDYVAPLSAIIVGFAFLLLVRRSALQLLIARAAITPARLDDLVVPAIKAPSYLWCFIGAVLLGLEVSTLPDKYRGPLNVFVQVALIASVTLAVSNLAIALIRDWLRRTGNPSLNSGLVNGVVMAVVFSLGGLSILGRLGIEVAPLLTAFGVAGLTVALAFKDTLENAFSGIYLLLDQAMEVGDHITLEGGQKGVIRDIGWRTTKVETEAGDTLIVPNLKLGTGVVLRRKR